MSQLPLCVDCDGTLIHTDSLYEQTIRFVKKHPFSFYKIFWWALKGDLAYKHKLVSQGIHLDPALLPYNQDIITYLSAQKNAGRRLFLATGAHESIARDIASHLALFEQVFATDDQVNLIANNKRQRLEKHFGSDYAYIGDSDSDLEVWPYAKEAIVYGTPKFIKKVQKKLTPTAVFHKKPLSFKSIIKLTRIYQWVKNGLIFLPLILAHRILEPALLVPAALTFIAFSFIASSIYILNDLLDLDSDRQHSRKRKRPLASGDVSILTGVKLFFGLNILAYGLAFTVLPAYTWVGFLGYQALVLAYSLKLKRLPIIDLVVLGSFYVIRILIGGFVTGIPLTFWLIGFSLFLFFSLACAKRSVAIAASRLRIGQLHGRGYVADDYPIISNLGVSSAMGSVLFLALYIQELDVTGLYPTVEFLWPVSLLFLFWIARMWLKVGRKQMTEDPIVFTFKDPTSYFIAGCIVILGLLSVL